MSALTIVMYHYVRDLAHSRYPAIKALNTAEFEKQLDWITQRYTVCSTRDVIVASRGGRPLPLNACLLTFDDGLIDHFTAVFPRLVARGLTGSFYPPAIAARQERVLDTHKIHFILAAAAPHHDALAQRVRASIDARRKPGTASGDEMWALHGVPSALDVAEVAFVKRVLQRELQPQTRAEITDELFAEYVGVDEKTFARELYMDVGQLRCMIANGMEVGGHGAEHVWFEKVSLAAQRMEIDATVEFLAEVHGQQPVDWVMCYPFGSIGDTLTLLPPMGCALGLTTERGTASTLSTPLKLPRIDTIHLPPRGDGSVLAAPSIETHRPSALSRAAK